MVGLVCYYRPEAMAISVACRRLGIPVFDYQHGAQNDQHPMYTNWSQVPKKGYDLLPSIFWVWGDVPGQRILNWIVDNQQHNVFVGGNLWFASYKKRNALNANPPKLDKPTILVTLQGEEYLSETLLGFLDRYGSEYQFYFREHPRLPITTKSKARLQRYSKEAIDVTSRADLYPLFGVVNFHITGFSTVAFEAQGFGIPSVFIHDNAKMGYGKLLGKNGLYFADSADELQDNLKLCGVSDKAIQGDYINTEIFPDALVQIRKLSGSEGIDKKVTLADD
jgi:hypothetical protein